MIIKNPNHYILVGFQKSLTNNKKYDALLRNKSTMKIKKVPFGDLRYQQFKDRTPLKLYSHLDHNDVNRRRNYLSRHQNDINNKFSSGYFSARYLW